MKTLSDFIHDRIQTFTKEADELVNRSRYDEALQKYAEAWNLLPEPKEEWEAATWLLAAIGDTHFHRRDFLSAIQALSQAIRCPDGLGNPFIHLRLGEAFYELEDFRRAGDELTRAYMGAGPEIFENEDAKYLGFLRQILKPPLGASSI